MTDGAGLLVLRRLWDELEIGSWIARQTADVGGWYRPALMMEVWTALLWYGGGWLDDLKLIARRGVRRLFDWTDVPDPTTFSRWLRRAGASLLPVVDRLLRHLVQLRWEWRGVPAHITLALDSTVVVRPSPTRRHLERGAAKRLRAWLFRMPRRWTHHAEQWTLDLPAMELTRGLFTRVLQLLRATPAYAH